MACAAILAFLLTQQPASAELAQVPAPSRPNIIVFLVDDLGWGDLSMMGHPTIRTPNLDQMAWEGIRLTSFYSAPSCSPARGMFLTSRYPPRTGLLQPTGPAHPNGIRAEEVTLAEALKEQGYRTAMFGKWHLGDFHSEARFNPTAHGFDTFLGIPYSHDYSLPGGVPLYRDTKLVEQPVVLSTMTRRFTEEAIRFIRASAGEPFFIYIAHPMPHIPIAPSERFRGHSRAGRYGDVVEELDWSVGEVLKVLKDVKIARNTILAFASDNGPWMSTADRVYDRGERGAKAQGDVGWSGLLRGEKGTTWEGGIRVPAFIRWPARIPAGQVSSDIVSIMDLYPTFLRAAGGRVPADRPVDGLDIMPLLTGTGPSPRKELFYFLGAALQAVREGAWKLRVAAPQGVGLFNLNVDPAERYNVAVAHPDIVTRLRTRMTAFREELELDIVLFQSLAWWLFPYWPLAP